MINPEAVIRAFVLAKKAIHYYWVHTSADQPNGMISIDNVAKIIQRMTGVQIITELRDVEASYVRSITERYDERADVLLRANQEDEWLRYSAIKEYSHILIDAEEQFQPDPLITLEEIVSTTSALIEEKPSAALQSEDIAEIFALEIVYPHEFREADAKFLLEGGALDDLVEKRGVPAVHIEKCTNEHYYKACQRIWDSVQDVAPEPLPEDKFQSE